MALGGRLGRLVFEWLQPIKRLAEVAPTHTQSGKPASERFENRVAFASFDSANIVEVQFSGETQIFLRELT